MLGQVCLVQTDIILNIFMYAQLVKLLVCFGYTVLEACHVPTYWEVEKVDRGKKAVGLLVVLLQNTAYNIII